MSQLIKVNPKRLYNAGNRLTKTYSGIEIVKPKVFNKYRRENKDVVVRYATCLKSVSRLSEECLNPDKLLLVKEPDWEYSATYMLRPIRKISPLTHTAGYIAVSETEFIKVYRNLIPGVGITICMLAVLFSLLLSVYNNSTIYSRVVNIEIPTVFSNRNNCVSLYNPDENRVYFQYEIHYAQDKPMHSTGLIYPGRYELWNISEVFESGEHNLEVKINIFNIETKEECGKYIQYTKIKIK